MKSLCALFSLLIVLLVGCSKSAKPAHPTLPFDASGVFKSASGIEYKVLKAGNGAPAETAKRVSIWYEGRHVNNQELFDSTRNNSTAVQFSLNRTIPGFARGIRLMREGDIFLLKIPSDLAYGPNGAPPVIAPNEDLYFTIELVKVID
jgi:FKBP-type peptidyl-prolyl cis-trans isomerase FkpA